MLYVVIKELIIPFINSLAKFVFLAKNIFIKDKLVIQIIRKKLSLMTYYL